MILKNKKKVKFLYCNRGYDCRKDKKQGEKKSKKIKIGIRRTDFLNTHQEESLSEKYRLYMDSSKNIMTKIREVWIDLFGLSTAVVKPFSRSINFRLLLLSTHR